MLQVNQTSSGGPVGFSDSLICGFVFRQSSHRSRPVDEEIQVRGGRSGFEVVGSEAWLVLITAGQTSSSGWIGLVVGGLPQLFESVAGFPL